MASYQAFYTLHNVPIFIAVCRKRNSNKKAVPYFLLERFYK
nr:MAG TPA: hypothetical protein [Bacteriophage sp.]